MYKNDNLSPTRNIFEKKKTISKTLGHVSALEKK